MGPLEFAALGLARMLNSGGALRYVNITSSGPGPSNGALQPEQGPQTSPGVLSELATVPAPSQAAVQSVQEESTASDSIYLAGSKIGRSRGADGSPIGLALDSSEQQAGPAPGVWFCVTGTGCRVGLGCAGG